MCEHLLHSLVEILGVLLCIVGRYFCEEIGLDGLEVVAEQIAQMELRTSAAG